MTVLSSQESPTEVSCVCMHENLSIKMLRYSETLQVVYSAVQTNTAPCCRGSTFCLLWGRGRLTDRHTVAAPHASAQTRCALQKEAHAVYNRGKYVSFHTHAPQPPFEWKIKGRASLTPLQWATVATGWPCFYGYAVPSAFLPGQRWQKEEKKRKEKGHEYVGAAQPRAGGSLNQHKQRKTLADHECEFGVGSVDSRADSAAPLTRAPS